jgi:hypothetical protein
VISVLLRGFFRDSGKRGEKLFSSRGLINERDRELMDVQSREKLSMGSIESRDLKSILKFLFRFIWLLTHFVFVIVSRSFALWRSLSRNKGLQSELEANNKEGECVRQRLRFQDAQLERVKENTDLLVDEEQQKYGERDLAAV